MSSKARRRFLWMAGGVVVLGVFGYFAWGGLGKSLVYFWTPTELLAKGGSAYGTAVRLGGMVVPGSVEWNAETRDLRFRLTDGDTTVPVESRGAPPQMFAEGIGVVVEGVFTPAGVFRSHNVMVKHSSEYRAPEPGKHPAEYYRKLFRSQASP
ncbi:MAG: cytochrome c maturation protein CcmE [Gemmatimonadetes bacterium]|nr:cytochrome c maturation protein CcmE [Gemmatimonadota bacterium]